MRIFFFPPVPLWSKEVTKSAEAHKHGRKLGERWLTVRLFKQGLSSSGSGRGAQCEQVSSNQPIALYSKTAENMPLLGSVLRGSTPENAYNKSMCCSSESAGARSHQVQELWFANLCLFCLSKRLHTTAPCSSGVLLLRPDAPGPLCCYLCISHLSAFFPVASISLHYRHLFFYSRLLYKDGIQALCRKGTMNIKPSGTLSRPARESLRYEAEPAGHDSPLWVKLPYANCGLFITSVL